MFGGGEFLVAHFLAEQTMLSMKALTDHPALLDVGTLVRHSPKRVVEAAMIIGPIVFHNEGANGEMHHEISYRVVSLDDMKLGYAKNIREVLLLAPYRPWVPAHMALWQPPAPAREAWDCDTMR